MSRRDCREGSLPLAHAVALGLVHGPAELLPVSSSAHVALIPRVLDWPSARLSADVRKAFEVALHAGTLCALVAIVPRPSTRLAILGTLPAVVVGLALEAPIERRLGGARATAAGLIAGSMVLVAADHLGGDARAADDLGSADALALGLAQAVALMPGMSRLGMAVAAARLRGFAAPAAFGLGRSAGLPIVAGATALKSVRLAQRGLEPRLRAPFAAAMVASAASTLAARTLMRRRGVRGPAAERVGLAIATMIARRCGR